MENKTLNYRWDGPNNIVVNAEEYAFICEQFSKLAKGQFDYSSLHPDFKENMDIIERSAKKIRKELKEQND
jgi:hypothetical protein